MIELAGTIAFQYKDRFDRFDRFARFDRARPSAPDPTLRPALGNPAHQAYPSAHAFQMHAVAEVLSRAVPEHAAMSELFLVAARVAENREHAGVHTRSDTEAGVRLSIWALAYICEACRELMLEARREWI